MGGLNAGDVYTISIYAFNVKGRSEAVDFQAAMLGQPEKQLTAEHGKFDGQTDRQTVTEIKQTYPLLVPPPPAHSTAAARVYEMFGTNIYYIVLMHAEGGAAAMVFVLVIAPANSCPLCCTLLFFVSSRTTQIIPVTDTDNINSHWHNVSAANWWLRHYDRAASVEMPEPPAPPPPPQPPPEQRPVGRPALPQNHIEADPVQRLARVQQQERGRRQPQGRRRRRRREEPRCYSGLFRRTSEFITRTAEPGDS